MSKVKPRGIGLPGALVGIVLLGLSISAFLGFNRFTNKQMRTNRLVSTRDSLKITMERALSNHSLIQRSAQLAENSTLKNCFDGNTGTPCVAGPGQPFVLLDAGQNGTKLSGTPTSPKLYDDAGAACEAASNNCLFQVSTSFTADCGSGIASCAKATSLTYQYSIAAAVTSGNELAIRTLARSVQGAWSALADPGIVGGRLTFESDTPVSTNNLTARGTLYYTPFIHKRIALYSDADWAVTQVNQISLSLAGIVSGSNYDVFIYDNAGVISLELGPAWTNDTTRSVALGEQDGVLVKNGAPGHRYLGTLRASAASASEDSQTKRFLWNMYNRVPRKLKVAQNWAGDYVYNVTAWRPTRGDVTNRVEVVIGGTLPTSQLRLETKMNVYTVGGLCGMYSSIGVNSMTVHGADIRGHGGANVTSTASASLIDFPRVGYSYYQWIEVVDCPGLSTTFNPSNPAGMLGDVVM